MKTITLILLLTALAFGQVYTGSFLNLHSPITGVSRGDFEFAMNHRFFGAALKNDPLDSFFGLDNGANVRFGIRYYATDRVYIGGSHARLGNNNSIYAGWSAAPAGNLLVGIEAGYSSVKPSSSADREGNINAVGSASIGLFQDKLRPVINLAYDGYRENTGAGFGIRYQVAERLALLGEYYPAAEEDAGEDCFGMGMRYNTWGHQFLLGLTNTSGIGVFDQIAGSNTQDLSFALSVRRLF